MKAHQHEKQFLSKSRWYKMYLVGLFSGDQEDSKRALNPNYENLLSIVGEEKIYPRVHWLFAFKLDFRFLQTTHILSLTSDHPKNESSPHGLSNFLPFRNLCSWDCRLVSWPIFSVVSVPLWCILAAPPAGAGCPTENAGKIPAASSREADHTQEQSATDHRAPRENS